MVKHIVLWKVKGTAEDHLRVRNHFQQMLDHLKSIMPEIREAKIGMNFVEGDVFHMCIDSAFDNKEDLQAYIVHPDHMKIRDFLNSVTYEKAVFDYEY